MFNGISKLLLHHKFAGPPSPNLKALREAINAKLEPICFHVKNDPNFATYVHDEHFYGILCSPLFEGKSYSEMNQMVHNVVDSLGLGGRVRLHCQPPSRYHKLERLLRERWTLDG